MKKLECNRMKVIRPLPDDMTGHILVFEDPLIVHQTIEKRTPVKHEGKIVTRIEHIPTGKIAKCYFMRATGGFGCYKRCSGRMICGDFYETIDDVLKNNVFDEGNTKCYPTGYIPDLFTEHEEKEVIKTPLSIPS